MTPKTYAIFGAGAAGLYTAWRLLSGTTADSKAQGRQLVRGDTLRLYDWGRYNFLATDRHCRAAGARVCTWHHQNQPGNSYLELGGMRYSDWDGKPDSGGHRLVTRVIADLKLTPSSVPFNESTNPLFYLRTKNKYLNDFTSASPAPYHVDHYGADTSPDTGFNLVENLAVTATSGPQTRAQWCDFFTHGRIAVDLPDTSVYRKGDLLKNIGYWNLMFDQLGSEGFGYTADGNGYTSNVINWNSAVAFEANNEFTPGTEYKTLRHGYSTMFNALFDQLAPLANSRGITFEYIPDTRLHSILQVDGAVRYSIATRAAPDKKAASLTAAAAWLAMPRAAVELVAQATRYEDHPGLDVLNHRRVQLYLESAILQPSYKVGMFFASPWWLDTATYPPQLESYEITSSVIVALRAAGFPPAYLDALSADKSIIETPFAAKSSFLSTVEQRIGVRLALKEEQILLAQALRNTIGPSVTDTPIRQVVYFGNNAPAPAAGAVPVYGILASYDDEMFTDFWRELELDPSQTRETPLSADLQTLDGPRVAPAIMVKMLRAQLAALHFGPQSDYTFVPEPLETRFMDWSLPPFNAGYHAWAAHYDIADVQRKIRKPSQLIAGADADIFIVGEAYSNDQAWVEGAYCTAESVLNDFFGLKPLIDPTNYPFICPPPT